MTPFYDYFVNKFKNTVTLKFELIPQRETLANIEKNDILSKDDNLALSYAKMKKTIDEYHKWFIDLSLSDVKLSLLDDYFKQYNMKKDVRDNDYLSFLKNQLRREISNAFSDGEANKYYTNLFNEKLLKLDLPKWINEFRPDLYMDDSFKSHTTYFKGFNENRKNVYTHEEICTSIAYRLINENLPKFIDNINLYNNIKNVVDFSPVLSELEEVLQGETLDEIFTINYYNKSLTQIGIDFINTIIGGIGNENGKKIKGLNEYINLYNQKQKDKNKRVGKFKVLYKQILADKTSVSFKPNGFENDTELLDSINSFYRSVLESNEKDGVTVNILEGIKAIFNDISSYDLHEIYIKRDVLSDISNKLYDDYTVSNLAISAYYDNNIDTNFVKKITKKNISEDSLNKELSKKDKWNKENISIHLLEECLDAYVQTLDVDDKIRIKHTPNIITSYLKNNFNDIVDDIKTQYGNVVDILNAPLTEPLKDSKRVISLLKSFMESIIKLQRNMKIFMCGDISNKDVNFYTDIDYLNSELLPSINLYNNTQSYITTKPYSTEKIKLNFGNATLLDGWDENKEYDNSSIMFKKDGGYYLGIMNQNNTTNIFDIGNFPISDSKDGSYEKMIYKQVSGANLAFPKCFFGKDYLPLPKDIERIRNTSSHTKKGKPRDGYKKADFVLEDCHLLIDYFKSCLKNYDGWDVYDLKFSETSTYNDISDFYKEFDHQTYKISFVNVPDEYINEKVSNGELYLFKIHNKDFSEHSKGMPNLHTIYWKMLFDEDNINDVVYKLNGSAEIFFRKASIKQENMVVHPKNHPLKTKNPTVYKTSTYPYDIIKDKRYTVDKFMFHVSICMNYKAEGKENINHEVNAHLQNNPDVNIIGIDRGERNLLYVSVINQKGEILEQKSLNNIVDEKTGVVTPYHTILGYREKERAESRQNWTGIGNIKETKSGYLSKVVSVITKMMIKHNAIIVMENLNNGFKRNRIHIDTQIYQAFEEKLIKKLNHLVFKNKDKNEIGGALKALQLSCKFISHNKLGTQSGFVYYVPAWNTSKIDPTTGFVNLFKTKFTNMVETKKFFANFDSIKFNANKNRFEFSFDYKKFTNQVGNSKSNWVLCADNTTRYSYNHNKKAQEEVKLANELCLLFENNDIEYKNGQNLIDYIVSDNNSTFYKRLVYLFNTLVSLRHNNGIKGDGGKDMIISPVENENGVIFNSDNALPSQPSDADANGAYHIALKGLWILNKINKTTDLSKIKLAISNNEWLHFAQNI